MKVKIYKSEARGAVTLPPSKSIAHRMIICALLSYGESIIKNVPECDDVIATLDCVRRLGATVEKQGDTYKITGIKREKAHTGCDLYVGESGSTLRFLIPILLFLGGKYRLFCKGRLFERPLGVYEELFFGSISKKDGYIEVDGTLTGGEYALVASVSSQFISGLLFALPLCARDSKITLNGKIESRSYIDLTLCALSDFGVKAEFTSENEIFIKGNQSYASQALSVEGDYSAGIFIEALNFLYGGVLALGLREDSLQGDRVYREIFEKLRKKNCEIDLSDCPDNAPMLFALSALTGGARFTGTSRLKIKESDRASAMKQELLKLGAVVKIEENAVTVKKSELYAPSEPIDSHNDHRIAMAMAVVLTRFGGEILGAEAVKKSYPGFFEDLRALGVRLEEEK